MNHPSGIEAICDRSVSLDDFLQVFNCLTVICTSVLVTLFCEPKWISDTVVECHIVTDVTLSVLDSYMLSEGIKLCILCFETYPVWSKLVTGLSMIEYTLDTMDIYK